MAELSSVVEIGVSTVTHHVRRLSLGMLEHRTTPSVGVDCSSMVRVTVLTVMER